MNDVTVGIKTFFRPQKIEMCLKSLEQSPWEFKEIIVADDGKISDEKQKIYKEYKDKLPLEVLDLEFDLGAAAARNKLFEESDSGFFLLLDDDMVVPSNIDHLKRILLNREDLGGVAGMLYGNGDGTLRAGAHDIFIKESLNGKTLVRDIREDKKTQVETDLGEKYIYIYDFLPTCTLFRKKCLEETKIDPNHKIGFEHLDLFMNHKMNTEWNFALSEEVIFGHYPGGEINFESHRQNENKLKDSKENFKQKWGIDRISWKDRHYYSDRGCRRKIKNVIKKSVPDLIWPRIERIKEETQKKIHSYS